METPSHLNIELTGKDSDHLPLKSFLVIAQQTYSILRRLSTTAEITWRVEAMSLNSPLEMQVGSEDAPPAEVADTVGLYLDLFDALTHGRRPSLRIPTDVYADAFKLVGVLNDGIAAISFSAPGRATVIPNAAAVRQTLKGLSNPQQQEYSEITTVEGELKTISVADGRKVYIYDRITNDAVECSVDETMFRALFSEENMGRRVSMRGQVLSKKGRPSWINVHSYEFLPSDNAPSTFGPDSVDITGGVDSVEFLRKTRDGT